MTLTTYTLLYYYARLFFILRVHKAHQYSVVHSVITENSSFGHSRNLEMLVSGVLASRGQALILLVFLFFTVFGRSVISSALGHGHVPVCSSECVSLRKKSTAVKKKFINLTSLKLRNLVNSDVNMDGLRGYYAK